MHAIIDFSWHLPLWVKHAAVGCLVFVGFWIVAVVISRILQRLTRGKQPAVISAIRHTVRNAILLIGLVTALGTARVLMFRR